MNDDPYPQTLPQQLRELGERWGVGRLRGLYTTSVGRFVLYWVALVILLQIAAKISDFAATWGWNFGTRYEFWLPNLLHSCRYATAQIGAIALVIWFQCRWPSRNRWGVFIGLTLGYALFPWVVNLLAYQRATLFGSSQSWLILHSLLRVAILLFFVRSANVIVRLFLVDRTNSHAEQNLPRHNSWSLQGMFLVVILVACFLARVRQMVPQWTTSEIQDFSGSFWFFWWGNWILELLILLMLAYAVAANRIRPRRWIWWLALVVAVAVPQFVTWMYWYFIWPPGPGRPPLQFATAWIDAIFVVLTLALLKWFFVACERSGYQLAMWIRGSDDAIPTA